MDSSHRCPPAGADVVLKTQTPPASRWLQCKRGRSSSLPRASSRSLAAVVATPRTGQATVLIRARRASATLAPVFPFDGLREALMQGMIMDHPEMPIMHLTQVESGNLLTYMRALQQRSPIGPRGRIVPLQLVPPARAVGLGCDASRLRRKGA